MDKKNGIRNLHFNVLETITNFSLKSINQAKFEKNYFTVFQSFTN